MHVKFYRTKLYCHFFLLQTSSNELISLEECDKWRTRELDKVKHYALYTFILYYFCHPFACTPQVSCWHASLFLWVAGDQGNASLKMFWQDQKVRISVVCEFCSFALLKELFNYFHIKLKGADMPSCVRQHNLC